jgi:hypothetical protein
MWKGQMSFLKLERYLEIKLRRSLSIIGCGLFDFFEKLWYNYNRIEGRKE